MDAGQTVGQGPHDGEPKRICDISAVPGVVALPSIREVVAEIADAGVTSLIGSHQATHQLVSIISAASTTFGLIVQFADHTTVEHALRQLEHRARADQQIVLIVSGPGLGRETNAFTWSPERVRRSGAALVVLGPYADAQVVIVCSDRVDSPVIYRRAAVTTCLAISPVGRSSAALDDLTGEPIEIDVLGPIDIRGIEAPLRRRPKLTELVVYLAMHPRGATSRAWTTALWPDRRVPVQTVANRLSEARRALGFAPDGRPRLRRDGEHHLIADATTDWQRFTQLADPGLTARSWKHALELIRGRPFDDLQQGQWTTLEGFASEIEQSIVSCALRFGRDALENGQPGEASWAAQMALRAAPWDERLHRLLMHTADACGNRAGVEAILRHLALVLEIDGDPLRGVHPETAALYELLSGRATAH